MIVLPENMDRLDPQNVAGSLSTIENYIRYMGERLEFAMANTTRSVNAAGISSAEVYILLTALKNDLEALTSDVGGVKGTVTGLSGKVSDLNATVTGLTETVTANGIAIAALQDEVKALKERVDALK